MSNPVETYFTALRDIRASGAGVQEVSYYGALEQLLNDVGHKLKPKVRAFMPPEWLPFPDPLKGEYLHAPFGCGVYELRNRQTKESVLYGRSKNVAYRMSSLLPRPLGCGTRNNSKKRQHVERHLAELEYRTRPSTDVPESHRHEGESRDSDDWLFPQ